MHARQLIEIAGLLSLRSGALLRNRDPLCSEALSEYWIASRCRADEWGRCLRSLGHSRSCPPTDEAGNLLMQLVEELTLSEALTRVVAAIGQAADRHRGTPDDTGPIGVNTFGTHREAISRMRALHFAWWSSDSSRSRHAASLRAVTERWTDALLAYVSPAGEVAHLAHNPSRLAEFAYDGHEHGLAASQAVPQLLVHALRVGFASADQLPLCPELNHRIAGAAIALFGSAGFDDLGLTRPVWALRAERTTSEAVALIERFFHEEPPPSTDPNRLPARWRI